jgi:hypothetical protein
VAAEERRLAMRAISMKEIGLEGAKVLAREQIIGNYHPAGSCMVAPSEKG